MYQNTTKTKLPHITTRRVRLDTMFDHDRAQMHCNLGKMMSPRRKKKQSKMYQKTQRYEKCRIKGSKSIYKQHENLALKIYQVYEIFTI